MLSEDYSTPLLCTEFLEWEPETVEVSPTQDLNQLITGHECLMTDDVAMLQTIRQMDTGTLSHLLALALECKKYRCLNYLLSFTDHLSWSLLSEFELYSRYQYHNHGRGADKYRAEFWLLQRIEIPSTLTQLVTLLLYPTPHPVKEEVKALEEFSFVTSP